MVETKKPEEKKPSRRIKATTGAWWKSTIVEEVEIAPTEQKPVEKTAIEETPKAKPAGRRPRKASVSIEADQPPVTQAPTVPEEGVEKPEKVAEKPKTPRKRAPRKPKAEVAVVPETAETAIVTGTPEVISSSEVVTEEPGVTEDVVKPKRQPRKRPPRRKPREVAEKPLATSDLSAPAINEGDVEGDAAEPVEVKAPAPRRAQRKRKPPVKKTVPQEGNDNSQAEDVVSTDSATPAVSDSVVTPVDSVTPEDVDKPEVTKPEGEAESTEVAAPEKRRRKPSQRRSRGRRKDQPKTENEADTPDTAEQDDDEDITGAKEQKDWERTSNLDSTREKPLADLPEDDESEKESVVLKLLINAEEPEECRLALLENGRLESIHVSTINRALTKNNIYKGRIVAIEPNLQAAFIDYGTEKNGFLPFSEIHPEYYKQELSNEIQGLVDSHQWKRLSILDVVEKGQDVMVQVVKEEVGKKGANMTTYLSLPGRSVVLMPGSDSSGISRKISGEERRSQLRTAMNSLGIPEGIGWIVRTASVDITKTALARDVGYLLRLWEEIKKKAQGMDGVGQVYEDHQSVLRFLREHFDPSIEEILVDDLEAMEQVKEFISLLPSKQRDVKVRLHKGSRPIFNQFSVEDQIESIYQPRVNLPSGGSIVIDPTEALVAIDVNSGSTSKGKNFDQSIYQANLEAASEIGRQLRLRDLGGLVVVDFIDMRNKKHIRDVERQLKVSMKRDKAKVDFSRISKFGLMQISRQKLGSPIEAGNYRVCQHCKGRGIVRSVETLALFYLRRIQTGASRKHVQRVECHFPLDVAQYLQNNKRLEIHEHETRYDTEIIILGDPGMTPVEHEITLHKAEKEPIGKKQA